MILPTLVGPRAKIEAAANVAGLELDGIEIIDVPHSDAVAKREVELVRDGTVRAIMKGKLHTDELMRPILHAQTGIRTKRRMSHIFVIDMPTYPKPLIYLAGADAAGIVVGARVPIILTSRADGQISRLASCAIAQRFLHAREPIPG